MLDDSIGRGDSIGRTSELLITLYWFSGRDIFLGYSENQYLIFGKKKIARSDHR